MPIRPYLTGELFEPDVIHLMGEAFEQAMRSFPERLDSESVREMVASRIIVAAQCGERDVETLRTIGVGSQPKAPSGA